MDDFLTTSLRFWNEFSSWHPTTFMWCAVVGFAALASWIIIRFVSAPPFFAGPVSFCVLVYSALVTNFAGRSTALMGVDELQKTLLFTVVGQSAGAIVLLAILRVGHRRFSR